MKIAVLSDIHGNTPALEAVVEDIDRFSPDLVLVNGDVVNRGPEPAACVDLLAAQEGWRVLRGNHEDYVLAHVRGDAVVDGPLGAINAMSGWTHEQLRERAAALASWPDGTTLALDEDTELRVRHASMRGNRDGIFVDTPPGEVRAQIAPAPPYFVTGHTHRGFVRRVDDTTIVNAGSVGQPNDGDRRASYAQLMWRDGRLDITLSRVAYDVDRTERLFETSGWFDGAGPVGRLVYEEWRRATSVVVPWMTRHREAVLAGREDLGRTVTTFLASL